MAKQVTPSSPYAERLSQHEIWVKRMRKFFWYGVGAVVLLFIYLSFQLPSFRELEDPSVNNASVIYGDDGTILGSYFIENRQPVKYAELSEHLVHALVATEDMRFYDHSGIDGWALLRVLGKTVIGGDKNSGGGSTVSQQLAKLLLGRPDTKNSWLPVKMWKLGTTKFKEWLVALKLERCYTKEEIIALYFNQFDFLYNAYGIKSAAKTYFNKFPKDLNIQESAMLVGMLNNPAMFNPVSHPKAAQKRRSTVLNQMRINGYLSTNPERAQKICDSLEALPIDVAKFKRQDHTEGLATHFRETLREYLKEKLKDHKKPDGSEWDLYKDGLRIYTTINPKMQKLAEDAAFEHLKDHQKLLFEHWKGLDPWTKKPTTGTEVPVSARLRSLHNLIYSSERYIAAKDQYMPKTTALELTDVDVDRMQEMDRDEAEKKGGAMETLDGWAKSGFINSAMESRYRKVYGTADWETVKAEKKAIDDYFAKPIQMKVYNYRTNGDLDTLMSPFDSVRYHRMMLQAGSIAVDPHNGHVKVWVGGRGFRYFKLDHARKETRRQVGSTIKPFLYGLAIAIQGYSPCFAVQDIRWTISPGEGDFHLGSVWQPDNAGGGSSGATIPLKDGLKHSLNTISCYLMKTFRSTKPLRDLLAKVGIDPSLVPEQPSICLGSSDLSVFEMTGGYTIFANQGVFTEPLFVTRVEDKHGNLIYNFEEEQQSRQALSKQAAYAMTFMLHYVTEGQGGFDGIKTYVGGKTGTTQDQSDGWFMGITPNLVMGTWVGCDDRFVRFRTITYGQGARMARPIFQKFMRKVEKEPELKWNTAAQFVKPDPFDMETTSCSGSNLGGAEIHSDDIDGWNADEYLNGSQEESGESKVKSQTGG